MRSPIARCAAQRPTREHVGLPVSLLFESADAVIQRQNLQRPDPGMATRRLVEDEGSHETGLQRYLTARKALAASALEPPVGTQVLTRPRATEGIFKKLGGNGRTQRRIDALPEFMVNAQQPAPGESVIGNGNQRYQRQGYGQSRTTHSHLSAPDGALHAAECP